MRRVLDFIYLDMAYLLLKTPILGSYAKKYAHYNHNQLLRSAAFNGKTRLIRCLLTIPQVRNNAHANHNAALCGAVANGHIDIVMELLEIKQVVERTHENENKILRVAARNDHFELLSVLLSIPAVKNNAHVKSNSVLMHAIIKNNFDAAYLLLRIPSVMQNIYDQSDDLLYDAIKRQHVDVVNLLLITPIIREKIENNNSYWLGVAAKYGNVTIIGTFLTIPTFRDNAHANQNSALYIAIKKGHTEVVKRLLTIRAVRGSAHEASNEKLFLAAKLKRFAIVETLLKMPNVWQELLANREKNLLVLFQGQPACRQLLIDNITLYGLPLSTLLANVESRSQIDKLIPYFYYPIAYLESKHYPPLTIEAVRILHSAQLVDNYKHAQAERERQQARFNNVDDEARIGTVMGHYHTIIKPHFAEAFNKMGETDTQRLLCIEMAIRKMLFQAIAKEAEDKQEDIFSQRARAFIDSLDEDQKPLLFQGNDNDLMHAAREAFIDFGSEAQTAWRAYDAKAVVRNSIDWPNLLTAPLVDADKSAYTVSTVGLTAPTRQMASDLAREMIAYSYLLAIDQDDGDDQTRMLREVIFITKVAEIRRAHNNDMIGLDDPSCLPGTVSRAGDMWVAHSKSVISDAPQLLVEELRSFIIAKFQQVPPEQQETLYHALVMLSDDNAVEAIAGKVEFSQDQLALRQQFKERLGSDAELHHSLNQALQARQSRILSEVEFNTFALALLANIGGRWIAPQLTTIYRNNKEILIENPYSFYLKTNANSSLSKIQVITLLKSELHSVELEGKFGLIIQVAEKMVIEKSIEALALLENKSIPVAILQNIRSKLTSMQINTETLKEKELLWNDLYQAFAALDTQSDKGEMLRHIVTQVIDDKQNLNDILKAYPTPIQMMFDASKKGNSESSSSSIRSRTNIQKKTTVG